MCPSLRLAWLFLLSLLLLMGCGGRPAALVHLEVPPPLLACQPAPAPPARDADDQALALWIVDLSAAGEDCRSRLRAVKDLLNGQ